MTNMSMNITPFLFKQILISLLFDIVMHLFKCVDRCDELFFGQYLQQTFNSK